MEDLKPVRIEIVRWDAKLICDLVESREDFKKAVLFTQKYERPE